MKKNYFLKQSGFTFIETILYIAIVSLMMTALIPFAWNSIEGGVKSTTEQEVFSQARYLSERIKYEIRNASGINSVAASQISLVASGSANPTIIALSAGNITIKQGSGSAVSLNSADTKVSALLFTNYSSSDNKTKNIQFVFTIDAKYPSSGIRQEFTESTTIESDAEVRSN